MRTFSGVDLAGCRFPRLQFGSGPTADYYGLAGIFFSTHILPNVGPKTNGPPMLRVPLDTAADRDRRAAHQARLAAAEKAVQEANGRRYREHAAALRAEAAAYLRAAHDHR